MKDQTNGNSIRLALVDDQVLLRAGMARLLAAEPGFEVVGEYGTPAEAMEKLRDAAADVVLLGFDPGVGHWAVGFMSAVREAGYGGRFLVLAGTTGMMEHAALALKLGASGIFLKSEAPERLVQAIRYVAGGALWLDQRVLQRLADHFVFPQPVPAAGRMRDGLNDREQRALLGVLGGLTNKKIGVNMGLSESSVKNILQALFAKAGVRTRSQLVRVALQGSLGNAVQFANRSLHEAEGATLSGQSAD